MPDTQTAGAALPPSLIHIRVLGEEVAALAADLAERPSYHRAVVLQNRKRERAEAIADLRSRIKLVD
jgi:hypothetical protein